jgi:hypothetical protein
MPSDQCTLNTDGSLKDPKDIQWFNDPDDTQPLPGPGVPSTSPPTPPTQSLPLGQGCHNKVTNKFLDAVACERLDSDNEELYARAKLPRRKHASRASNISSSAAPPILPSKGSFEPFPEGSSDSDKDGTFQSDSGSESGDKSEGESTDLELISGDEVQVQVFSLNLKCISDSTVACQCSAEEDGCRSQPWLWQTAST